METDVIEAIRARASQIGDHYFVAGLSDFVEDPFDFHRWDVVGRHRVGEASDHVDRVMVENRLDDRTRVVMGSLERGEEVRMHREIEALRQGWCPLVQVYQKRGSRQGEA